MNTTGETGMTHKTGSRYVETPSSKLWRDVYIFSLKTYLGGHDNACACADKAVKAFQHADRPYLS